MVNNVLPLPVVTTMQMLTVSGGFSSTTYHTISISEEDLLQLVLYVYPWCSNFKGITGIGTIESSSRTRATGDILVEGMTFF